MSHKETAWICTILIIGLLGCTSENNTDKREQYTIDSLLTSRLDSIYTYPAKMEKEFRNARQGLSDSAASYKLELFIGYCRYLQGGVEEINDVHKRVLQWCQLHPEAAALEAICWNHRYALLQSMNQRDSAIACLHRAYQAVYRSDDRRELDNICINLADQYRQKGKLADAARYYRKALWVSDSLNNTGGRASIYCGLAQVYADLHNFRMAHHYFDLAEQSPDYILVYEKYHLNNSKGNCFYFEGKYPEALQCFREAYRIARSFNQPMLEALVEANIGEIFTLLEQKDSARHYLDKACGYFMNEPTANEEVVFYLNSLQAALALQEGKLERADYYLSRPYDSLRIGPSYIYLHNKRFMEYYARKGEFDKAYHYKTVVEHYDDSMRNVRHSNNIAEIDYRYSQDTTLLKRDILIANNRMQLSRQHNTLMLTVGLSVILALLGTLAFIHVRRENERTYNRQMALVNRLRMENVQNRISPHYIFNVLNTLMPLFKQYPDLSHLLQLFVQVLRGNLLVSEQIAVELKQEIELVKNYLALREETHIHTPPTEWKIDGNVPLQTLVPSMCIQIPVENALKYAFENQENKTERLLIQINSCKGGLLISIRDNGCGYNPGKQDNNDCRSSGNGLKMLFRTTEVLNNKNAEKMKFDIRNLAYNGPDEHGTQVTLFVPYNYQFNF